MRRVLSSARPLRSCEAAFLTKPQPQRALRGAWSPGPAAARRLLATTPPPPSSPPPPSTGQRFWEWTTQTRPHWRESRVEAAVVFCVFGMTGSTSVAVMRPALHEMGIQGSFWEGPNSCVTTY